MKNYSPAKCSKAMQRPIIQAASPALELNSSIKATYMMPKHLTTPPLEIDACKKQPERQKEPVRTQL